MPSSLISDHQKIIRLIDPEDIGAAVLDSRALADHAGFDEKNQVMIATVVSELATNIIRYAAVGNISIKIIEEFGRKGIEVYATDSGPGIADVQLALRDHYTTTPNSLGLGLSSVKRFADDFKIDSSPGNGTKIRVKKWLKASHSSGVDFHFSFRPLPGAGDACGDTAVIKTYDNYCFLALIDGVGHGYPAQELAEKAKEYLEKNYKRPLVILMEDLHKELKGTRGIVAALCRFNYETHNLTFCGSGNIFCRIIGPRNTRIPSRDGIIGYMISTPREHQFNLFHSDILMLTSDGVKENFDPIDYPNLFHGNARKIADAMIANFAKPDDDASCIILKVL